MATINSKVIFLTTSPRTPEKMIPEIALLDEKFHRQEWNVDTQAAFMQVLKEENFFNGEGANDPAFSARDRINRAPKSLGFINLDPISLTPAGQALISGKYTNEVFLKQMLKFQIPSPYHKPTETAAHFWVKPYLEIFRLIRQLGSLRFDEMRLFGLQLTDYHKFDEIVEKIQRFRVEKARNEGNYKQFYNKYAEKELLEIYKDEIASGNTKTRESSSESLKKFISTKFSNMRDYTDACFRYLRATGMVSISYVGKTISISPDKLDEVDFFLKNIDREPCFIDDLKKYETYLYSTSTPVLLTDNKELIIEKIHAEFPEYNLNDDGDIEYLKDVLSEQIEARKTNIIREQISELKDYKLYDEIQTMFEQIAQNDLYDAPLMLEWNTWRAMTMLDGGDIKANLKFDDYGKPMSTAQGNMADIICDYGDFGLTVEVTMASGQKQYEMESEPVTRHLGKYKKAENKPAYCLFIAPTINEACIAHFYALHKMNISYYGGQSVIVPLPLNIFQKMVEDSYNASYVPGSHNVKQFFEYSREKAETSSNEQEWYHDITDKALHWLP